MNVFRPLFSGFCLIFLLSGLVSCRKGIIKPLNQPVASVVSEPESLTAAAKLSSFRGVYVDNFLSILGRVSAEDSLLNWCVKNNLNAISLYNAATIVATPATAALLNTFIGKANGAPYNIQVALIATNLTIATNEYTRYYKLYPNKFSAITTEYEFWNAGKSYTTFRDHLRYLQAINDSTAGALKRQVYFSQFEDAEGIVTDEATIAQRMVSSSDKIFLVNYVNNAYNLSNTTLTKIKKLALAARILNKPIDIVILFNVNYNSVDPSIHDYFSVTGENHAFTDAYDKFKADYDNVNFTNKTYVKLAGFQLYKFSAAFAARPAIL